MSKVRTLNLLVEVKGFELNRHLDGLLKFLVIHNLSPRIIALTSNNCEMHLEHIFARLREAFPFSLVEVKEWPDSVDAFFPSPNGDMKLIRHSLANGVKTFQNAVEIYSTSDLLDYYQGYVLNDSAEWYATLFPEPVHIAHPDKIDLGLGVTINPRAIILNNGSDENGSIVRIGRASHIGADVLLNLGAADFSVGNFSMISANFAAHAARHSISHISNFSIMKGPFAFFGAISDMVLPITVGNDVWIAEGVKCLPGVHINNGAVIGAGSIVTRSVDAYGIYAGNPAQLIRYRFEKEKNDFLNDCCWWNIEFDRIKAIREYFKKDITSLPIEELRSIF